MTEATSASADGVLQQIWIYPVKSCRRVALQEATVTQTGLLGDRMWQVVDAAGNALTQRNNKELARVAVQLNADAGLTLSLDGASSNGASSDRASPDGASSDGASTASVVVPPVTDAPDSVTVKALLGDEVRCADAGDEAAEFLSDLLGEPARLAGFTSTTRRPAVFGSDRYVTFVDATPLTVANTASLADLENLAETSFGMERFRPNLVVATDTPWVEDTWADFSIGVANFRAHIPWPRCSVPQVDQDSAERTKQPAKVLKEHRWCADASAAFPNNPGIASMVENNTLFAVACTFEPDSANSDGANSDGASPNGASPNGTSPNGTSELDGAKQVKVGDQVAVASTKAAVLAPPGLAPPSTDK